MNATIATINNTYVAGIAADLEALVAERDALAAKLSAEGAAAWEFELLLGDVEDYIYWTLVAQHNALRGA
jgi:hypothetical protein